MNDISVIPIRDLKDLIRSEMKEVLSEIANGNLSGSSDSDEVIKRKDIAEMFGVSLVTVHDWMTKGILPHYKMNGRTYFKKSEVIKAMKLVKIRRSY